MQVLQFSYGCARRQSPWRHLLLCVLPCYHGSPHGSTMHGSSHGSIWQSPWILHGRTTEAPPRRTEVSVMVSPFPLYLLWRRYLEFRELVADDKSPSSSEFICGCKLKANKYIYIHIGERSSNPGSTCTGVGPVPYCTIGSCYVPTRYLLRLRIPSHLHVYVQAPRKKSPWKKHRNPWKHHGQHTRKHHGSLHGSMAVAMEAR